MPKTDPIVDAVCAKLQARSSVGIKKYGTTLAGNYATAKEKLIHIQEELMDAANYIEWLLQEKEMPTPMTIEMEADARQAALDALTDWEGMTFSNKSDAMNWFCICMSDHANTIRAALSAPRVPEIEGLDEAIKDAEMHLRHADGPVTCIAVGYLKTLRNAARAYAELQKGN